MTSVPSPWLGQVLLRPHVFAAACLTAAALVHGPIREALIYLAVFFLGVAFAASLLARFATDVCRHAQAEVDRAHDENRSDRGASTM
jgi:hypothetical protein